MAPHRTIQCHRGYRTETVFDATRGVFCERRVPLPAEVRAANAENPAPGTQPALRAGGSSTRMALVGEEALADAITDGSPLSIAADAGDLRWYR